MQWRSGGGGVTSSRSANNGAKLVVWRCHLQLLTEEVFMQRLRGTRAAIAGTSHHPGSRNQSGLLV